MVWQLGTVKLDAMVSHSSWSLAFQLASWVRSPQKVLGQSPPFNTDPAFQTSRLETFALMQVQEGVHFVGKAQQCLDVALVEARACRDLAQGFSVVLLEKLWIGQRHFHHLLQIGLDEPTYGDGPQAPLDHAFLPLVSPPFHG